MTADYPDFQAPGAIANLIGALGLATQSFQATANQISAAIASTGIPAILPQLLITGGPVAASTSWSLNSGNPVVFGTGGAYEIILRGGTSGTAFVTDVTVTHQDSNGNSLYVEKFTASNWSNGTGSPGVIIRGHLHGQQLTVTGLSCAQAFITALFPANPTVTTFSVSLYAIPYALPARPKMMPFLMSGILRDTQTRAVGANATVQEGPLASYCGLAKFMCRSQTGGGFDTITRLNQYTVFGGSGVIQDQLWFPLTGGSNDVTWQEFMCSPLLKVMEITEVGGFAGAVDYSLDAVDYV